VGLTVLAGVALFEVALVPGVVIGGAAVLAPKYLPKLRKRLRPVLNSSVRRRTEPAAPLPEDRLDAEAPAAVLPKFAIGQAIAKTITFRIIVTTLDFTTNYLVIGELGTAAGLSTFNLVAGPLFYLAAAARRWGRVHDQPGVGEDGHLSDDRHGNGLHHELCGGRRRGRGGGFVSFRLHPRPLRLLRSREGLGLFQRAAGAHGRSAGVNQAVAGAGLISAKSPARDVSKSPRRFGYSRPSCNVATGGLHKDKRQAAAFAYTGRR
jgi:uncharacterized membrane protein